MSVTRTATAVLFLVLSVGCSEGAHSSSKPEAEASTSTASGGSPNATDDSGGASSLETTGAGGSSSDAVDHGLVTLGEGNQCADCPQLGEMSDRGDVLVFSDDFVGTDLDRTIWTQEIGMVRNKEEQCYLDRNENIIVSDGMLTIRAIAEQLDDPVCSREWEQGEGEVQSAYSSAAITTKDRGMFKYGYIEARIRVPSASGTWPAFWMRPQERVYGNWPTSGEIDVMEHVSQQPNTVHGTVHFDFLGHAYDGNELELEESLNADFHTYAVDWSAERIDWYFDRQHYHSFDLREDIQGRRPFNESFYLLLNLAVGGHWPESPLAVEYPAELLVDWVRVWQRPI